MTRAARWLLCRLIGLFTLAGGVGALVTYFLICLLWLEPRQVFAQKESKP